MTVVDKLLTRYLSLVAWPWQGLGDAQGLLQVLVSPDRPKSQSFLHTRYYST